MNHVTDTLYGSESAAMAEYLKAGEERAYALGNRGPARFGSDGKLAPEILDAYWKCGFYVFEDVFDAAELDEIEADILEMMERFPTEQGSPVDKHGRPALAKDCTAPCLFWSKPLADPFGGTDLANGRHPVKMFEPEAAADAPKELVYLMLGSLQFSDALLRAYGHPSVLQIAESINGDDFVPFTDALFIKDPGRGASVAWHQDGTTHWEVRIGMKANMATIPCCSFTGAQPQTACGWYLAATSTAARISKLYAMPQAPTGCRTRCRSLQSRAIWP